MLRFNLNLLFFVCIGVLGFWGAIRNGFCKVLLTVTYTGEEEGEEQEEEEMEEGEWGGGREGAGEGGRGEGEEEERRGKEREEEEEKKEEKDQEDEEEEGCGHSTVYWGEACYCFAGISDLLQSIMHI
jgi:hypothetical protein